MRISILLFSFSSLLSSILHSQTYHRADTIKVKENGNFLKYPWAGGLNFVQVSEVDMNFDGKKDLFMFDRTSHKVYCFINGGTPGKVDYYDSTAKYASHFPHLEDWALIRDYNHDGLPDIFTYAIQFGGIKVWRNTSSGGNLQFTLETPYIKSDYGSSTTNLYVSRIDLPSIEDIDGDGDLDVVTIDFSLTLFEYHVNRSVELGYGTDSLIFKLDPGCWGHFNEPQQGCGVHLNQSCKINMDNYPIPPLYPPMTREEEEQNAILHDGGNCVLCLDVNGDKVKDILLGQKCCNMTLAMNGGSQSSANMISKDTTFPVYNIPIALTALPCGFYVDVNNDSVRDLLVCPNMVGISGDKNEIWYYKNTGSDSIPVFSWQKNNFLQEDMIDVGTGSDPVFFDYDNDGLTDILVSNYSMQLDSSCAPPNHFYNVWAYKNTGTASLPQFTLADTGYANLSSQLPNLISKHLTFGDLDGDLVTDMMIGDYNGYVHFLKNTGGSGPANFVLTTQNFPDSTGNPIKVGTFATPQLVDVNRDGKLDLIIGTRAGTISYYQNIGTTTSAVFALRTKTFGGIDVLKPCCTGYSVPFMYDSAGSYRLIVGSEAGRSLADPMGWIWKFNNIDGNLNGNFSVVDSMFENIWEGERMAVNGKDINSDGIIDMIIGNSNGGMVLYLSDSTANAVEELANENFDFTIYPNPSACGKFQITNPKFQISRIEIFSTIGEKVFALMQPFNHSTIDVELPSGLGQGIYFCKVSGKNFSKTKKLVILK